MGFSASRSANVARANGVQLFDILAAFLFEVFVQRHGDGFIQRNECERLKKIEGSSMPGVDEVSWCWVIWLWDECYVVRSSDLVMFHVISFVYYHCITMVSQVVNLRL